MQDVKPPPPEFLLRVARPDDMALIHSAWTPGAYKAQALCPSGRPVPHQVFKLLHERHVQRCVNAGKVLVAVHPDDEALAFGFVCLERVDKLLIVHWLFVKSAFRRRGIAAAMMDKIVPAWRKSETVTVLSTATVAPESDEARALAKARIFYFPYGGGLLA